ncbi:MAG: RrF2 family transcriptional regulator [Thermoanaerobaculum sp.]
MLTATTQHALRALAALAALPPGARVLARELARVTNTPLNYMGKILVSLEHAGFVDGKRGARGGYRLAKRPEEITLAEVVRLFEGSSGLPSCLMAGFRNCSDEDGCPVHSEFKKVRQAWEDFLSRTTLSAVAQGAAKDLEAQRLLWSPEGG